MPNMSRYTHIRDPLDERYFFGRITREQAEERMREINCSNGHFLLRESLQKGGNYVLSLYHRDSIYHYAIDRQYDNTVAIKDGRKFPGPIELVQHHKLNADGLLCRLTEPVTLRPGEQPRAFAQMTHNELTKQIIDYGQNNLGIDPDVLERDIKKNTSSQLRRAIDSVLHRKQGWFHGKLSREDAEKRIMRSRPKDGSYLVRERNEEGTFALSLFFGGIVYHYKIDKNHTGDLSIKDGPKFQSLMQMIDHYILKKDGLLCCLTLACTEQNLNRNSAPPGTPTLPISPTKGRPTSLTDNNFPSREPPPVPQTSRPIGMESVRERPPPVPPPNNLHRGQSLAQRNIVDKRLFGIPNDQEKIYDHVAKTKKTKSLNPANLTLMDQLGKGNFGSVLKGTYRLDGQEVFVAVKTLKDSQVIQNGMSEIEREADLMADLDHQHIVRMIGICKGQDNKNNMMLVLELAELGPLHKYLKRHQMMTIHNILELMLQVAQGMEYLESKHFVHRDLAARNVLLVTETFAKISDFGMSKALVGKDNNYYVAEQAGRWPLKWYAPECIYKFKFSSKSDIWSYGVTLWEAMSYGKKPYVNMKGQEILNMIEDHKRLGCPEACPEDVYQLMLRCWEYEAKDRITFSKIGETMVDLLRKLKLGTLKMR